MLIDGRFYAIEIWEATRPVALSDAERTRWKHQNRWKLQLWPELSPPETKPTANGQLRVRLDRRWDGSRSVWSDGSRGQLETKLASVLDEIERRAKADAVRDERLRQDALRRTLEEERHRQRELMAEQERRRAERLVSEATAWRRASEVREYVTALRSRLPGLASADATRLEAWCEWASGWAQEHDPLQRPEALPGLDFEGPK